MACGGALVRRPAQESAATSQPPQATGTNPSASASAPSGPGHSHPQQRGEGPGQRAHLSARPGPRAQQGWAVSQVTEQVSSLQSRAHGYLLGQRSAKDLGWQLAGLWRGQK